MLNRALPRLLLLIVLSCTTADIATAETEAELQAALGEVERLTNSGDPESLLVGLREALVLSEDLRGGDSLLSARLTFSYGKTLLHMGRDSEASAVLTRTLDRYEVVHGKESVELIPVLLALSQARIRRYLLFKAEPFYDRALAIQAEQTGRRSAAYGDLLVAVGLLIFEHAKLPVAWEKLHRGYQLIRSERGPDHPTTGHAAFQLGRVGLARKNPKLARKYLKIALQTFRNQSPEDSHKARTALGLLVKSFEDEGASERANEYIELINEMRPQSGTDDPFALYRVEPSYPRGPLAINGTGRVRLAFTIDESGRAINPTVLELEGHKAFGEAALKAIVRWRFAPYLVDGKPRAREARQEFDFIVPDTL